MSVSNSSGVTGGVFLPTLAFGAMVGSLCGEAMIALGWIGTEHYTLMVVLGITAFLGSVSRIPVTACVFAIEAMGGIENIIHIIIVSSIALLTVEISGLDDFTDTLIEAKLKSITKGKKRAVIEVPLKVGADAFVIGKEVKDILWPHSCLVISFEHSNLVRGTSQILEGDVVTMYYETYDPQSTADELEILVGKQDEETRRIMNPS
jgi:CIC family chloride channel protein